MRALARHLPTLATKVPWVDLGTWPTPLTPLTIAGRPVWIKHEGDSDPVYGGNKIRTLELWFGHARERGARRIWTIGAYGSNHAIATIVHAPRAGLEVSALLFPQPFSEWAVENCGAMIAAEIPIVRVRSVIEMPFVAMAIARRERDSVVMPPGGATPIGTFGAMSAAFELADQIDAGIAPPPKRIVLAIGSTCTTAGLLAGLSLAHAVGVWRWPVPIVHGVRVTPWPVTSRLRIAELAHRTLKRVAALGGPRVAIGLRELVSRLVVDGRELGDGYGRPTPRSTTAIETLHGPRLDGVYSAKAAAAMLRLHREGVGPLVFWATKSTATLEPPSVDQLGGAPRPLVDWLR
ncbi:MAG: 1-aminocyclopropane-carboxylate deaminase [Myxococcales bacterium]|nr:1-aminocyclopropane-carboxylate deaminase [Myxococcales bacterium]